MAKVNVQVHLQKLLKNELSPSSKDKNQIISGYKSLIDLLQIPQINKQLHGHHELLFECISQIILTSFNQFFDDNELRLLLELASNACVLSMSQNQIIDGWLQNIEERTFEKPDNDEEEDDDDDDLYEDLSESEEETEEEEEKITTVRDNKKRSNRGGGNQPQQKHVFIDDPFRNSANSTSAKEKSPPLTQSISNQRNAHVAHSRGQRGGHQNFKQNDINESSSCGNNNRGARGNSNTTNIRKGTDNTRGKGSRPAPFDNKYGVDLRLYDCYICGEYGHVQYDCPQKRGNTKFIPRGNRRGGFNNKKDRHPSKSSSSDLSIEINLPEIDQTKFQEVYNQSLKLLNSSQTKDERNKTFESFLSLIKNLEKQHGENLSKILVEKESIFYPLFCHIAQNDFLFTDQQYSKLYHLKNLLLPPQKQCLLNEDRSIFSRQRILIPLNLVQEHIENNTQIQQIDFNDFQEHIIRSTSPISKVIFDLIKYFLRSNIHINIECFDYFTNKILFDLKKDIFSTEQFNELHSYVDIRRKRFQRNCQKQIWKERLISFKNDNLSVDLNQWISEFEQILKSDLIEQKEPTIIIVDHAMWYFAVLLMASSGHLNKEQYEVLLKHAIQSSLFNQIQKFYFQFYLDKGQAPISIKELNEIKMKLESNNNDENILAYEQINIILDRPKPEFNKSETNDQPMKTDDIIPIIDNHVLLRLISLVEIICSDSKTFSNEQCTQLLDKFLQKSSIVRPLSNADQQRLKTCYTRPISLNDLKILCSTIQPDLNNFLSLFKDKILVNNDEIYDFLTETIVNIFENRRKYSNEKCEELKNLTEKKTFGKRRCKLINENYQKFRLNQKNLPSINPTILNQLLTNILSQDNQAVLEFYRLLEDIPQIIDLNEITNDSEINRCLLSTIILVINDIDHQRLKPIIEKETKFFSLLLTKQQYELIMTRSTSTSDIDPLINLLKTDLNKTNYSNLINFIENNLKDKNDFDKIINFILYTFDNQFLSIEQTLHISNLIIQHSKLNNKTFKNLLQFLIDLLQQNVRSSPKILLNSIETNQDYHQTMEHIIIMLTLPTGKYAVADWKRSMMNLLIIIFDRQDDFDNIKDIALQSPMLQTSTFKQQLESYSKKTSDESTISKSNDHSIAHREIFRHLESDDASMNALVVEQLHAYLLDGQLSPEILPQKFIQALQIIFKNPKKFPQVSLDEWATLISKNRGKIFPNDVQCDKLILEILFIRLNIPIDTLNSLNHLIQSKKANERQDGLQKLILLLKNSQMKNQNHQINNLPTISNQLYNIITRVVFDQKFNDNQVRQCLTAAKNSWLLNDEHRQKLNEI